MWKVTGVNRFECALLKAVSTASACAANDGSTTKGMPP
jgi:hypothetical protein